MANVKYLEIKEEVYNLLNQCNLDIYINDKNSKNERYYVEFDENNKIRYIIIQLIEDGLVWTNNIIYNSEVTIDRMTRSEGESLYKELYS